MILISLPLFTLPPKTMLRCEVFFCPRIDRAIGWRCSSTLQLGEGVACGLWCSLICSVYRLARLFRPPTPVESNDSIGTDLYEACRVIEVQSKLVLEWIAHICLRRYSSQTLPSLRVYVFNMVMRRPLQRREIEIMQRMKLKLKYPVTQVAAAVGRPKNVVYRALSINLKKPMLKRGFGNCTKTTSPISNFWLTSCRISTPPKHVWQTSTPPKRFWQTFWQMYENCNPY